MAAAEKNVVQSVGKVFNVLRAFDTGHPKPGLMGRPRRCCVNWCRNMRMPLRSAFSTASVRERGYAVSDGENAYGLRTIAAPILDADDRPLAGVSLSVRSERLELSAFVDDALPLLLRTTEALTRAVRITASVR